MKTWSLLTISLLLLFSVGKSNIIITDSLLSSVLNSSLKNVHKIVGNDSKMEIIEGHILIKKGNDYIFEVFTDYDSVEISGIEIFSNYFKFKDGLAVGSSIQSLKKLHSYAKFEINHDDGFSLNSILNTANCGISENYSIYVILRSEPAHEYDYESYIDSYTITDIQNTEKIQSILIFKK